MINKKNKFKLTNDNLEKIRKFHKISGELKKEISETNFLESDYDFSKIFLAFSVLSPQQWGPRIERVLIDKLGFKKVSQKGRGDAFDEKNNTYFEIKCSIITVTNGSFNLVQIRNWEKLSGYYVSVLNLLENGKIYNFYLSKIDMEDEINLIGSSAHGDKKTASRNINHEKRMSIKFDKNNKHFKRWLEKYSTEFNLK